MLERLKIYSYERGKYPSAIIETSERLQLDPECRRCPLNDHVITPCMPAFGMQQSSDSRLLVVSDYPGRVEDSEGVPMTGRTGAYLRPLLKRHWDGSIYLDNALRCAPSRKIKKIHPNWVAACRSYLASALDEIKPTRILAMGKEAILGVLGRSVSVMSVRRGYSFLSDGTPVFLFPNPVNAMSNRFIRAEFEKDLIWALTQTPVAPAFNMEAWIVNELEDALLAEKELRSSLWFSLDAEWSGVSYRKLELLCVACAPRGKKHAWVWSRQALKDADTKHVLVRILEDKTIKKVGQNIKSDSHAIWTALNARIEGIIFDARLMRKVLNADADARLEVMAELVGMGGHKEEAHVELRKACVCFNALSKKLHATDQRLTKQAQEKALRAERMLSREVIADIRESDDSKSFAFALIEPTILMRYNAADAIATGLLIDRFESELIENDHALFVWNDLVFPTIDAVIQVERWGMAISRDAIMAYQEMLKLKLDDARAKLTACAGNDFNPDSPKQVADLLYRKLKFEIPFETDSGAPSTDEEALHHLKLEAKNLKQAGIIDALLEWRHWNKQRNTYAAGQSGYDGLLAHVRADGRIHTTLNVDGARSGRTSSSDPNLQNIPTGERETYDKSLAKMAREIFVASYGCSLISADYSQLELRVAAMLSGDPEMKAIFDSGEDYHLRTAQMLSKVIWGIEPSDVQKEHRKACKAINFGLLYGQGDKQLAEKIGSDVAMAAKIRVAVLGRFKVLAKWIANRLLYAQQHGGAWTYWKGREARWRPLLKIADERDKIAKGNAERSSWNTPVQGTASEFCVQSLVRLVDWIKIEHLESHVKVILPVHDSVMVEVKNDLVDLVARKIESVMTGWETPFNVPLEVDVEVGGSWGSLQKIDLALDKKNLIEQVI